MRLQSLTDFDVFMSIMNETKNADLQKLRTQAFLVLSILFPGYTIKIGEDKIIFKKEEQTGFINNDNFNIFKQILCRVTALIQNESDEFKPIGEQAKKIAEKLNKARRAKKEKEGNKDQAILPRYISILAVGEQKDMNSFNNYTIYQIFDEFERYILKVQYDVHIQAQLAGATGLEDVDD